jgi:hypothetical protein
LTGVFQFWGNRAAAFEFIPASLLSLEKTLKYARGKAVGFGQKVAACPESGIHPWLTVV